MKAAELEGLMSGCYADVLDSMCFVSVYDTVVVRAEAGKSPVAALDYGFGLGFAGDVSGRFGLQVDRATASELTANFLAKEKVEVSNSDIDDVVGELANMLCGSVVSRVDGEHSFVLTHPEPIQTLPDFDREDVLVSRLETDSGVITTWFVVDENQWAC